MGHTPCRCSLSNGHSSDQEVERASRIRSTAQHGNRAKPAGHGPGGRLGERAAALSRSDRHRRRPGCHCPIRSTCGPMSRLGTTRHISRHHDRQRRLDMPSERASNVRRICVKISPVTPTAHIMHIRRNGRSGTLCGRFKDRDALHVMGHRDQIERSPADQSPFSAPEPHRDGAGCSSSVTATLSWPSRKTTVNGRHRAELTRQRQPLTLWNLVCPGQRRGGVHTLKRNSFTTTASRRPHRGTTAASAQRPIRPRAWQHSPRSPVSQTGLLAHHGYLVGASSSQLDSPSARAPQVRMDRPVRRVRNA